MNSYLMCYQNTYSSADEIVEAVQTALDVDGEAISGNYSFDDLHITLPDYLYEATGEDMCALLTDTGLNSGDASSFVGYTIGECVSYLLSMDDLDAILSDLEAEARCVVDTDISNDGKIAAEIGRGLARMFSERLQLQGRIPAYQAFVKWVSDAPHT